MSGNVDQRSDAPGQGGVDITPSDSTVLDPPCRDIYVGGAGDVKVTCYDGSVCTFHACAVGKEIPMVVTKVWATGTTATLMTGYR